MNILGSAWLLQVESVLDNQPDQIRIGPASSPQATAPPEVCPPGLSPDIALWRPSLLALILSGVISGGLLGAADGIAFHYIVDAFPSPFHAALWGGALGLLGGALLVLVRRAFWGPDISVEIATLLGVLYGVVPGLAVLFLGGPLPGVPGTRAMIGVVMACSMLGLVIGGLLDRLTDVIVARWKRLQQQRPP